MCSARRAKREQAQEALPAQLSQPIGQLKVEWDWLKKKWALPRNAKRAVSEPAHPQRSIERQGELWGLPRATSYDHGQGENAEHLQLLRLVDAQYTQTPYDGVRRMTAWRRSQGDPGQHKRSARLLRTMGVETSSPKPCTSQPHPTHRLYPYGLRGGPITRGPQGGSTDMTYMRLPSGVISLTAVREGGSR